MLRADAERLAALGLLVALEPFPRSAIGTVDVAIDLIRRTLGATARVCGRGLRFELVVQVADQGPEFLGVFARLVAGLASDGQVGATRRGPADPPS